VSVPITPVEARRRLSNFSERLLGRAIRAGLGAGTRKAMRGAVKDIVARGVGRGIWGGRKALSHKKYMQTFSPGKKARRKAGKFFAPGVAPLIATASKVKTRGDLHRGGIQVVGMAANIELGRPTKPHTITTRSGATIRHPGSRVPRNPILQRRARRAVLYVGPAIEDKVEKAVRKAGLD